ncbi:MAG: ABC-F family ATP-binding cassette domain-containing protein [Candidatus Babeliaceae bacterium]|nr:ABC-F family ATP-binding cassette domain-containing protein [Candidatus Babeliaceae bacterium]
MITVSDLSLRLGDKTLFDHLSFSCAGTDKVGLIGRNGMGKTTLLNVIAGLQHPDEGRVVIERDKKIAYLPQQVVLRSTKTVFREAMSSFVQLELLVERIAGYERLIDEKRIEPVLLEKYALCCSERAALEPEKLAVRAKLILQGLGFFPDLWERSVETLSAGWRMRLVLAKLLLQEADYYLFDEPTNHLDIVSKDWFLSFLHKDLPGFILVSHDRFFLDNACTKILELERGVGKVYNGNYSIYEAQKVLDREMQQKAYEQQQRDLKHKMLLIDRFRAKASKAAMAQSLIKKLEKIELIEQPEPPPPSIRLSFKTHVQPGKIVLKVSDVAKSFGTKKIFEYVSFEVERGERVALVAANGVGKTTLLSIIEGLFPADEGSVVFGHNVRPAFFEQEQDAVLDKNKTVLDEALDVCKTAEARIQVRNFLGAFLFPGKDVEKQVNVLSGGEKNRLAMVKLLLSNPNFLVLDEPTNHLDIDAQGMLLNALQQYIGTILFVSHERSFLNALATCVVELTPMGTFTYRGNYDAFLEQKAHQERVTQCSVALEPSIVKPSEPPKGRDLYELRKKVGVLERKIEKLENQLTGLHNEYVHCAHDASWYEKQGKKVSLVQRELDEALRNWEELIDRL